MLVLLRRITEACANDWNIVRRSLCWWMVPSFWSSSCFVGVYSLDRNSGSNRQEVNKVDRMNG